MERFSCFSRIDDDATPAPSATVTVYLTGTQTLASLYDSDDVTDPKSNPFTTGVDGLAEFYAANGRYDVQFSGGTAPHTILTPWALGDLLFYDPADGANLGGPVNVRDAPYNATGLGLVDDTAAIQAAIDTGRTIYIPAGLYLVQGLHVDTPGQVIYGDGLGVTLLIRQQNGTIIQLKNRDIQLRDLSLRGESATPGLTGDNLVIDGGATTVDDIVLADLDVRWTLGRAIYAPASPGGLLIQGGSYSHAGVPGDPVMILGHLGLADTVNYVTILGMVTHQANQPIRFIGVAGASIIGCQIGGLDIQNATAVTSSVNKVLGNRIIGNVTVMGASHVFTGNALAPTYTANFDSAGIGSVANGCVWVGNAEANTATIVNNGNPNNLIIRNQTSAGGQRFGDTASLASQNYDPSTGDWTYSGNQHILNAKAYKQYAFDGVTLLSVASYNTSNNLFLGNNTVGTFLSLAAPTTVYAAVGGVSKTEVATDRFRPFTDNALYDGDGSHRWKEIFAVNGAINTSDAREKQDLVPIPDAVLDAWAAVDVLQFRRVDAVALKGDAARVHTGVIAQQIATVFTDRGLDPFRYALLCHDRWEAEVIPDPDDPDGTRLLHRPAGDRYGVRPDQCLLLEVALQRRTTARLEARLAALEAPHA